MSKVLPLIGEKQKGETSKATQACNDYLRMGPGRSLSELHRQYTEFYQKQPPTEALGTLKKWSTSYGWVERAEEWDAVAEERRDEEYKRAMETGLALDYKRVYRLRELARFLRDQIFERAADGGHDNVWVPDIKVVGRGDNARAVEIEHFNSSLLREYREVLADIAAETGGRVKKQEITGADGEPVTFRVVYEDEDEDDEL